MQVSSGVSCKFNSVEEFMAGQKVYLKDNFRKKESMVEYHGSYQREN